MLKRDLACENLVKTSIFGVPVQSPPMLTFAKGPPIQTGAESAHLS